MVVGVAGSIASGPAQPLGRPALMDVQVAPPSELLTTPLPMKLPYRVFGRRGSREMSQTVRSRGWSVKIPVLLCAQVSPPSRLFRKPRYVPAYRVEESDGSILSTVRPVRVKGSEILSQVSPPSTVLSKLPS